MTRSLSGVMGMVGHRTAEAGVLIGLAEVATLPTALIGGKAAGLATLAREGFPVPGGLVLTTTSYREAFARAFPELRRRASFSEQIEDLARRKEETERRLLAWLHDTGIASAIERAAHELSGTGTRLIVRSSATLEDSATASFAGMLDTVGGLGPSDVAGAVVTCWTSLFESRALRYIAEAGISADEMAVAVIVQRQVEAERSGLLFSRNPTNRYASDVVVEAIRGKGEDIVSGEATPERYTFVPTTGRVTALKPSGSTLVAGAPAEEWRLTETEVVQLARWATEAERLFGSPQDMEWAFGDGRFWILQSRPIVFGRDEERVFPAVAEHTVLLHGSGVSPAVGSGPVHILAEEAVPHVSPDDVVVVRRLTNDLAIQLRDAGAVVADEGAATSHGANILREFGVPCVIGVGHGMLDLADGTLVTVDGYRGLVYEGDLSLGPLEPTSVPETCTSVFVSVLVPDHAELASAADGVSSLRDDYFLLEAGVHPNCMIQEGSAAVLEDAIFRGIVRTAELFEGKPVWYKTMDAPTDEFRRLAGGEKEPTERNPLLGWRGIGRELAEPEMLGVELRAIRRAVESGVRTIGIKLPFIRRREELASAKEMISGVGLVPHEDVQVGISVEIPAVAMTLNSFFDIGVDFVSVGLSDLTMCVLALDRESRHVAKLFDPGHPSVFELLARIADSSREAGVFACVTGEAARDERVLPEIVHTGFDAVGVSMSYFAEVKNRIAVHERALALRRL